MNPKEECEKLMNSVLPLAIAMLEEHGEFYPYGGKVTAEGEIIDIGVMDDDSDHPTSQALIDIMLDSFRQEAQTSKCRATAMVIDVKVVPPQRREKTDAIQVRLDHRDGYSVDVFFPYTLVGGEVNLEPPFAQRGSSAIFGPVH